ncbi:hypothetical protein L1049_028308 [Liquidambar formosana]|uniref:Remorin C-terminal domain-containing protein n=1 Tax=Liquidambar formosana TaxID=63359 RepID=A0AAP0RKB5_LIQFO
MRKPPETGDQKQKNLARCGNGETKADGEKAEMEKIRKRYEKMKSAIFAWENEKKTKAKLRMERKKSELEHRRVRNLQHYQMKIAGIDQTAGGARAQVEEKRRIEESKVKDKAKKIRSTGKVHNACLCF